MPLPLSHSEQIAKMTALQLRFPGWLVTAISPTATSPMFVHSCCKLGPAAWLRALAHGFWFNLRFDAAVPTKISAYYIWERKHLCLRELSLYIAIWYLIKPPWRLVTTRYGNNNTRKAFAFCPNSMIWNLFWVLLTTSPAVSLKSMDMWIGHMYINYIKRPDVRYSICLRVFRHDIFLRIFLLQKTKHITSDCQPRSTLYKISYLRHASSDAYCSEPPRTDNGLMFE